MLATHWSHASPMQNKRVAKAVLLVGVWAYAGATWASIGHHIVGLPDFTTVAALVCTMGAAAWTVRPTRSARAELPKLSAEEPSSAR